MWVKKGEGLDKEYSTVFEADNERLTGKIARWFGSSGKVKE